MSSPAPPWRFSCDFVRRAHTASAVGGATVADSAEDGRGGDVLLQQALRATEDCWRLFCSDWRAARKPTSAGVFRRVRPILTAWLSCRVVSCRGKDGRGPCVVAQGRGGMGYICVCYGRVSGEKGIAGNSVLDGRKPVSPLGL